MYLNPRNVDFILCKLSLDKVSYRVDGIYFTTLLNALFPLSNRRKRQSFDFTSLAGPCFKSFQESKARLFVAGGTEEEVRRFSLIVTERYPQLNIVGVCSGYLEYDAVLTQVDKCDAEVVLLGLGNIKQEMFGSRLVSDKEIPVFTCGAFISQTAKSGRDKYYPTWINKFHLRWLYRFFIEPHTLVRVIRHYPPSLIKMVRISFSK